jgi:NACHT domain
MPRLPAEQTEPGPNGRHSRGKGNPRGVAGGAAMAGGANFQAAVTAIALVSMVRGRPLGWLEGVVHDVPVQVLAETGGSGDDLQICFQENGVTEVQVKRGLSAGPRLWEPLINLSTAIQAGKIDYGILIVSPDSSRSIQRDLARDIKRLGDGRSDSLGDLAKDLQSRMNAASLPLAKVCSRLRIVTVHAIDTDSASIQVARAELGHLCKREQKIEEAWNRLYRDALELIELRGARTASSAIRVLRSAGVEIRDDTRDSPGPFLAKLNDWVFASNATFPIFGVSQAPSIDEAWISLSAAVRDDSRVIATDLAETLRQYHDWHKRYPSRDSKMINCETLGRFVRHAVVVAGPGMGKSTLLRKLARLYSADGFPVLRVSLSAIAAQMRHRGIGWSEALFTLALDGSGLSAAAAQATGIADWVLLCDGLDECVGDQDVIAQGLLNFLAGHPGCRAIVTTRPIGYRSGLLGAWRHYEVAPLPENSADTNLGNLIAAIAPESHALRHDAWDVAKAQLKASQASPLISRSPFLLSIAAALIVRGSDLRRTKTELYAKIFGLIERAAKSRNPEPPASPSVLLRFLDILGWNLIAHALSQGDAIIGHCAEAVGPELGYTPLQAREFVEKCLAYWQALGMAERVHHADEEMITFIHKTLGEFAAARFLVDMPAEAQTDAITAIVGVDEWSEVTIFAGSLGLATPICAKLLENHTPGPSGLRAVERALTLMAEADVPPDIEVRGRLIGYAFEYVRSGRQRWAYAIGEALVPVAKRFPTEVGRSATPLLDSDQVWTRVVAWTCAVVAGPNYYGLNGLIEQLDALPSAVEHGILLDGGLQLGGGNFGMLQHFLVPAVAPFLNVARPRSQTRCCHASSMRNRSIQLTRFLRFRCSSRRRAKTIRSSCSRNSKAWRQACAGWADITPRYGSLTKKSSGQSPNLE